MFPFAHASLENDSDPASVFSSAAGMVFAVAAVVVVAGMLFFFAQVYMQSFIANANATIAKMNAAINPALTARDLPPPLSFSIALDTNAGSFTAYSNMTEEEEEKRQPSVLVRYGKEI